MIIIKVEQRGKILARNSAIFLSSATVSEWNDSKPPFDLLRTFEENDNDGSTTVVQYFSNRFPIIRAFVSNAKRANIGVIENADFAPDKRVNDP